MSTNTPPLLRLPNELLVSILSFPTLSQPDLYHVAQSCRQFREVALEVLYSKDVTISWRIMTDVGSANIPKESRIIHTLLAYPERGHAVKRLQITDIPLYHEPLRCAYQRRLFARAVAAGVFRNVQHLTLDQVESDEWKPLCANAGEEEDPAWAAEPATDIESTEGEIYAHGFAALGTFPRLKTLEVIRTDVSFDIEVDNTPLAQFVAAHPGLKKLKLDCVGLLEPFVEILDSTSMRTEELRIGLRTDADYEVLRELVLKFPQLQLFRFNDLDLYGGQCDMQEWTDLLTKLSTTTNKGLRTLEIAVPIASERVYAKTIRELLVDQFPNLETLNLLRFTPYFRQAPKFWAFALRGHPKLRWLNIPDSFCRSGDKPGPEEMAERLRIFWDELPQLAEVTCWIGENYPLQHYLKVWKEGDKMKWKELDELPEDDQ